MVSNNRIRLSLALVSAMLGTVAIAAVASAQWPTTCVELNDIVEMSLGNHHNVGIYQRVFGNDAEEVCRNEHQDDARSLFAWANLDETPTVTPADEKVLTILYWQAPSVPHTVSFDWL